MFADRSVRTVIRPVIAVLVGAGFVLAALTGPAAASVQDTDRPKITTKGYDFGENWDTFGAPLNGGHLDWDVTGNLVTPELTGYLYLKGVKGECAHMELLYLDASDDFLASSRTGDFCATKNGMEKAWVTMDGFSHEDIVTVSVRLVHVIDGTHAEYKGIVDHVLN